MSTMTQTTVQVYQLFIKATPEQIWEAIVDPELTSKYFYGSRITITPEGRVSTNPDGSESWGDSEVLEWDPPRKLVHGWQSAYDPELASEATSRVTWEIESQDGGTDEADARARPARGRAEDGGERRRRLDAGSERPQDAARDRQATRRVGHEAGAWHQGARHRLSVSDYGRK